jgi:PTS system nitrogen regulatory IIA component
MEVSPTLFADGDAGAFTLPTLTEALLAGGVVYGVGGTDQASVLRSVVAVLSLPEEVDRDFLYEVLLARETLGSTGIGDGIAIPHVRNPLVLHVPRPSVTLCFLETPIDFHAIDGKPVDILFTLITPTARVHLHFLSRLGYVLRDAELRAALLRRAPIGELLSEFARIESALPAVSDETGAGGSR